jgi:hypothetical protein
MTFVSTPESLLLLFTLLGLVPTAAWMLVFGARRQAARRARELGLRPAALGYEGRIETVRLRLIPNAVLRYPEVPGAAPGDAARSATGETLIVATLPQPLAFPFFLESTAVAGRRLREDRASSGLEDVDAVFSLRTSYETRARRLLQAPAVRAALLALYAKGCCLFEIDSFDVAVHTGHHGRAVELARDAVALAQILSRAAVALGYARSDLSTS